MHILKKKKIYSNIEKYSLLPLTVKKEKTTLREGNCYEKKKTPIRFLYNLKHLKSNRQ